MCVEQYIHAPSKKCQQQLRVLKKRGTGRRRSVARSQHIYIYILSMLFAVCLLCVGTIAYVWCVSVVCVYGCLYVGICISNYYYIAATRPANRIYIYIDTRVYIYIFI